MNKIFKSISYTFISNITAFLISAIVTFIVPKRLGIENYSYFQLYLFYVNYTGFLHFGWADGIFLRYGGEYYDRLNKSRFSGQFRLYCIIELIFAIIISILGYTCTYDNEKAIVYGLLGVSIILYLPRSFLQYVLQCTNRIKEYSILIAIEKIVYLSIVILIVAFKIDSFIALIVADLTAKLIAVVYAVWQCKDFIFEKAESLKACLKETKENIFVGSKLMFSNFAGMLIIGIIRFSIEKQWDVVTFGKISLTMSVSNLLMLFIRAVSMVMFPLLRRTETHKLANIYVLLRTTVMTLLLGLLVLYYPFNEILKVWLPQYTESLKYMALLFPMCIFESKMSMLIETYMKTLRKEKELLFVNISTVMLSILLSYIIVFKLKNLDLAVVSIVTILAFRCIFAEILITKFLHIFILKDILFEFVLTCAFIIFNWFISGIMGLLLYCIFYGLYLFFKKKEIKNVLFTCLNIKKIYT